MDCVSWIAGRIVAWIVVCCLVCVMDCDLLLDVCDGLCVMVSWLPCCCMDYDLLLGVCHGLCIMVSSCVVAWIVMLFARCASWTVHHGFLSRCCGFCCTDCCLLAATELLKDGKRNNKTNNEFCLGSGIIFTQNKTRFSVNKNQNN